MSDLNWVEICIIDAIRTSRSVIKKPGHIKIVDDSFIMERYVGDIDHMDVVLLVWLGVSGPLTREESRLIADRHSRSKPRPWNALCKKLHCSRETCRKKYYDAIKTLEQWAPAQPGFNQQKVDDIVEGFLDF